MTCTIAVAGPGFAGTTSVFEALRTELPECSFVDLREGIDQKPLIAVFVVSASTQLVRSDCELLDRVAAAAGEVIMVVSKIDRHRNWRDILAANRTVLAAHNPRYAAVQWIGVAAAPDFGAPVIAVLVEAIRTGLADPSLPKRAHLRAAEAETMARIAQLNDDVAQSGSAAENLRRKRAALVRQRRELSTNQAIALRNQVHTMRLELSTFVRRRCSSVRTELLRKASVIPRSQLKSFPAEVRQQLKRVLGELDVEVGRRIAFETDSEVTVRIDIDLADCALEPTIRRLETYLFGLLGVVFGLGATVSMSRLLAQVGTARVGMEGPVLFVVCALLGGALVSWVIGARALLQRRSALERWIAELMTTLRGQMEDQVAAAAVASAHAMNNVAAQREAAERLRFDEAIAAIDRDIRLHAARTARAIATRDRQVVAMENKLRVVQAEFGRI